MTAPISFQRTSAFVCHACRQRLLPPQLQRSFTTTRPAQAIDVVAAYQRTQNSHLNSRPGENLDEIMGSPADMFEPWAKGAPEAAQAAARPPHRLHVYSHKHNTHLTLVQPPKLATQTASSGVSATSAKAEDRKKMVDVLLSLSTGNIGFRKSGRGTYDAAYQLASFTLKQMQEKGMLAEIQDLEIVLRGFGAGRDAVTKAILGAEGRLIRDKIRAVVDATRLKQGGTRSKKPRRLG